MGEAWTLETARLLVLPSGRLIRGRGLRRPLPPGGQTPEFGLYLLGREPVPQRWPIRWLRWPDFRLPSDQADAEDAFVDAWRRSADQRVEVACHGGNGRTGTALACIAILDGVSAVELVAYVRRHYHPRAVETPWQRWYVRRVARRLARGTSPEPDLTRSKTPKIAGWPTNSSCGNW